jgi:hypothetical protein
MVSKELKILNKFGRDWGIIQDTMDGDIEHIRFNESVIFKEIKKAIKDSQNVQEKNNG